MMSQWAATGAETDPLRRARQLFAVVAEQVARVFDVPLVRVVRYEPDGSVVVGGFSEGDHEPFPIGSRWPLDSPGVIATVRQTGRPARIEDYAHVAGEIAAAVRGAGMRSAVATPIVVERRLWGAMVVLSPRHEPFPEDTEARLTDFTELVATAIANAESRVAIGRLADEQAALRRVAVLVAQQPSPSEVFTAVTQAVGLLLDADLAVLHVFPGDGTATTIASWSGDGGPILPIGTRFPLDGDSLAARIFETGAPARMYSYDEAWEREATDLARSFRVRSAVGAPILVEGKLWGALMAATRGVEPWAENAETRIAAFTELVATAIANAESREALAELADEHAALRRVATLVAQEASPNDLFEAVAEEVGRLLPVGSATMGRFEADDSVTTVASWSTTEAAFPTGRRWPVKGTNVAWMVLQTGRPARIDDFSAATDPIGVAAREAGIRSAVGSPVVVKGHLWGVMTATSNEGPMPPGTEARLASFTELVATAIANSESREALAQLADEQAALRRVATLVAENVSWGELCAAVAQEAGTLLGGDYAGILRYEDDATVTSMATWAATGEVLPIPDRFRTEPGDPATMVAEMRQPVRVDDWTDVPGPLAAFLRDERAVRSSVGCPIMVEGRMWGALGVHSKGHAPLPPDTESRIGQFTELVATAIANREARTEVARLADEQAALRRVATLVARDAPREEVFTGIASEIGHLFGLQEIRMVRYDDDRIGVVVASSGPTEDFFPVGFRVSVDAHSASSRVLRRGEPVRMDDYGTATGAIPEAVRSMGIRSVVATPISVEGRLWGAISAGTTRDEPLPPETEVRLGQFTELMATAVANTESRTEVERLAEEQAALRRVATLVAEGAPSTAVFDAVAAEMEGLLGADRVSLSRYEPGAEIAVLAHRGSGAELVPTGSRLSLEGDSVQEMVRRTGRPARMENFEEAHGPIAEVQRTMGVRGVVAVPVVVDGGLWGVIGASWVGEESPPVDTDERMAQFAGLLETAIANADSRGQLDASRTRLVTEADKARRRVVRDLHDGAQQRLVHTIVTLKLAERALGRHDGEARQLVGDALEHAEQSNRELRELAHGILPAVLERGGLRAGVDAVVGRLDLPVGLDVPAERFPVEIEASAYFIVAEALTNVVKHAHAEHAEVTVSVQNGVLHVQVRDDGIGGADPDGHGLVGLGDRATALGGRLQIESAPGGGTLLAATLPLPTG
jgi:GAF domain-containing protein